MYEAATGKPAFKADSIFATMSKQMNEMAPPFASVNPDLQVPQLEIIVFKCLAKEPGRR